MKLNKREITLNEADSLQDVFRTEKILLAEYDRAETLTLRKEVVNEIAALKKEGAADVELAKKLWEKSKGRRL